MKQIKIFIASLLWKINPPFLLNQFLSDYISVHISPSSFFRFWFISPFNGQSRRLYIFYRLVQRLSPTVGIETGTHFGSSTWLFFGLNLTKIHSIEIDEKNAKVAKKRFIQQINSGKLLIHSGNSVDVMRNILSKLPTSERVIAYLDAHGQGNLPLREEVECLLAWGGPWVALVDDFKVENDSSYGFDVYPDDEIGVQALPVSTNYSILLPDESSDFESGAKKGTAYLVGNSVVGVVENEFLRESHLRLYEWPQSGRN
jgi:hypothetical protein